MRDSPFSVAHFLIRIQELVYSVNSVVPFLNLYIQEFLYLTVNSVVHF